jgi:hypothetical protein
LAAGAGDHDDSAHTSASVVGVAWPGMNGTVPRAARCAARIARAAAPIGIRKGSCGDSAASAILAPGWWLRANDADSGAYLQVKRDLAERTWRHVQHYADAKTRHRAEITARATAAAEHGQVGRRPPRS